METYREQLDRLNTCNSKHNAFSISMFKFMYWIKVYLGKKDGYVDWISRGKNCFVMTDVIQVINAIICDVIDQIEVVLGSEQFKTFKQLEKVTRLIIENFDNPIRSNPHIIYDEENDDPELDGNLLHQLENLIQTDNYLDEKLVNS